jgi:hypothetical protein
MDTNECVNDDAAQRATEILQNLSTFLQSFADENTDVASVLLALSWCLGYHVGAFPDSLREEIREMVVEEIDGIIQTLEEEGMAGAARALRMN